MALPVDTRSLAYVVIFVVDVVADFVDAVGCAQSSRLDAHGDGAHVELLLLDHLVGLVDPP